MDPQSLYADQDLAVFLNADPDPGPGLKEFVQIFFKKTFKVAVISNFLALSSFS